MALHRRVYLTGLLVGLVTALVALIGLGYIWTASGQAARLTNRNGQLTLLSDAQRDIAASQYGYSSAVVLPEGTDERRTFFVQASAQQQLGLAEWARFRRSPRNRILTSSAARQLDTDLQALPFVTATATKSPTESGLPVAVRGTESASANAANTTAVEVAVPALRVATDFNAVRQIEDRRWAAQLAAHHNSAHRGLTAVIVSGLLALVTIVGALALLTRAARRRDAELAERDRDLERVANSNEFEARLQRALELSDNEDRVYGVVEQALQEMVPELSVEMLLADSSRAHFQQFVATGTGANRCSVDSPKQCPAAQRGEVLTFESNGALDACPYLKQEQTPCSAVCIPVSVSGLTAGVVHAAGAHETPPDAQKLTTLELISRRASDRIGMMRAFSDSETQASTDPLTGLPNRRALENSVRRLKLSGIPYTVAFGDLDHFKLVNDKYGHSAGDHALRVFARVLGDQLRPDDIYGRYGGEEFLIVLPDCGPEECADVLDRIRATLRVTLVSAQCPPFTVSFGLAMNLTGRSFEETVKLADEALLEAKRLGRDRVAIARPNVSALVDDETDSVISR